MGGVYWGRGVGEFGLFPALGVVCVVLVSGPRVYVLVLEFLFWPGTPHCVSTGAGVLLLVDIWVLGRVSLVLWVSGSE